jgi:predicted permease
VVIGCFTGSFFCWLLKVPHGRRSTFKVAFYASNCLYIGLPTGIALFGEASAVYVFEYYVANTCALWGLAVCQMAREGLGENANLSVAAVVKKILFSPLIGLITAIVLILLGWQLPKVVKAPLGYIGGMTTPLSMIFVGIALSRVKIRELKMTAEILAAHVGKFTVGSAAILLCGRIFPASIEQLQAWFIQAAMPVAVATPVLAATYGLDVKYAAVLTSTSTLLFMGVVPLYMWFLHIYFGA